MGAKVISLDYDLGIEEIAGTGYDVCLWVEQEVLSNPNFQPPEMIIHSDNPAGIQKMKLAIESIERMVERRKK